MIALISTILSLFSLVLLARALLSWFPNKSGVVASINDFAIAVTEPVLAPIRRRLPPTSGGFDLSFLIVIVGIWIVRAVFLR